LCLTHLWKRVKLARNWSRILKETAADTYLAVGPLLGTEISRKVVGIGTGGDTTKQIDLIAERAIIRYLERNKVSCTVVGEECGTVRIGEEPEAYVVVDSIDGTTNAVRGISFASTSIAVSPKDRLNDVEHAIVMRLDNGKAYTAEKGRGAEYDGGRICPSEVKSIRDAVISIDISRSPENIDRILPLMKSASHIRCLGSAALEICQVGSGQLDAYVDVRGKLRTTDIAAAMLVLKEAGGVVLKPDGKELDDVPVTVVNRFSLVAASNIKMFRTILQKLEGE